MGATAAIPSALSSIASVSAKGKFAVLYVIAQAVRIKRIASFGKSESATLRKRILMLLSRLSFRQITRRRERCTTRGVIAAEAAASKTTVSATSLGFAAPTPANVSNAKTLFSPSKTPVKKIPKRDLLLPTRTKRRTRSLIQLKGLFSPLLLNSYSDDYRVDILFEFKFK